MPKKLKDDRNQFGTSTQLHVMVHLTVPKAVHDAVLRLHNRQNSSTTKTNSDSAGAIVQEISSPLSMLQSNAAHRTVSRRYATTLRSSQVAPRQQYWRRARSIEHNAAFANAAYSPRTGTLLATGRQRKICGASRFGRLDAMVGCRSRAGVRTPHFTLQQKRQQVQEIRRQSMQKREDLVTADQRNTFMACPKASSGNRAGRSGAYDGLGGS